MVKEILTGYDISMGLFCSQFRTEDFAGGLCCSYNDPRIITFDGTFFDTQALGQFYLVRTNVPVSPRLYEVTYNKILLINMENV